MGVARLDDDGETLITEVRIDRRSLVNGLFYGVEGMRVGGMRRLEIAPHLAYGDRGVPGVIPGGCGADRRNHDPRGVSPRLVIRIHTTVPVK